VAVPRVPPSKSKLKSLHGDPPSLGGVEAAMGEDQKTAKTGVRKDRKTRGLFSNIGEVGDSRGENEKGKNFDEKKEGNAHDSIRE